MFYTDQVAKTGLQYDEGLRKFMLDVYNQMMVALAISGLFAFGVSMNQVAMQIIWQTSQPT